MKTQYYHVNVVEYHHILSPCSELQPQGERLLEWRHPIYTASALLHGVLRPADASHFTISQRPPLAGPTRLTYPPDLSHLMFFSIAVVLSFRISANFAAVTFGSFRMALTMAVRVSPNF